MAFVPLNSNLGKLIKIVMTGSHSSYVEDRTTYCAVTVYDENDNVLASASGSFNRSGSYSKALTINGRDANFSAYHSSSAEDRTSYVKFTVNYDSTIVIVSELASFNRSGSVNNTYYRMV